LALRTACPTALHIAQLLWRIAMVQILQISRGTTRS
jgi:hypothetical protein